MKKFWWLPLLLCVVAGFYFWERRPRQWLDPATAVSGPVLGPTAPLGSTLVTAFLGEGWREPDLTGYRQTLSGLRRGSDLRFYLDQVTPVSVRLEGRAAPARPGHKPEPGVTEVWQDGQLRWKLPASQTWSAYGWDIPASQLHIGENRLELRARWPGQWRSFEVQPAGLGRTFAGPASNLDNRLAFGRSLAFPVQLDRPRRFWVKSLEPWLEPGAPGLSGQAELLVQLQTQSGQREWTLHKGGSLRLSGAAGPARLSLTAIGPGQPAPGQAGLRLGALEIEGEPAPSVSPRPANPSGGRKVPVIIYLIDTLRADHLGCYGYSKGQTPNIDRFARDAVVFERCTAQSGWTKPATASVLTSLPPRQHGAMDFGDKLRTNAPYLPQILQQAGYSTRAVVTNPFVNSVFGFNRGFDDFRFLHLQSSQAVNAAVLPWLRKREPGAPFFLYLHTLDPHLPYGQEFGDDQALALQALAHRQAFWNKPEPALPAQLARAVQAYDAEVTTNDASFGQLIEFLKERGLYQDSLIVVLSDHGEEFLDHGRVGHSNSLYQELLHVPLLVKFPGGRGAGTRVAELWQQIDVAPTVLQSLGLEAPAAMQGLAYPTQADPLRPALISMRAGVDAQRWGQGTRPRLIDVDGVRSGTWIYLQTRESVDSRLAPRELYDLEADPSEHMNLAWSRPEIGLTLNTLLRSALPTQPTLTSSAPERQVQEILRSLQYLR